MDPKFKIDLLCWLVKAKDDKPFYAEHKDEIDLFICILKEDILSLCSPKIKKRTNVSDISPYILQILQLISTFINST